MAVRGIIDGETGAEAIVEAECDPDAPRLLSDGEERETVVLYARGEDGALVPVGEWVGR